MCNRDAREWWFHPGHAPTRLIADSNGQGVRLVLLGPPGVGKGTQAALLKRRYRACHLSTGDLFRAAACESDLSPAMQHALAAMRRGDLVSDDTVIELLRERSACLVCHGGFLLDGVPRTLKQAEALGEICADAGVALDGVVLYELDEAEIAARICGRRTCGKCKAVFHETAHPPRVAGQCDQCGGALIQRDDDTPDVVHVRLEAYRRATAPLAEYYADRGELIAIPAVGTPAEVFERTCFALSERRGSSSHGDDAATIPLSNALSGK